MAPRVPWALSFLAIALWVRVDGGQPPNIVFFMADDAGWNDFGFTRGLEAPESELIGPQAQTPFIDALAREGVVLKRHYAYRYCSPSRASLLTGRLPFHVHERNPGLAQPGCTNLNYTMLPAKLAQAGYVSYHVGKWHQGLESLACVPMRRGFTGGSLGYLGGAEDHVDQSINGMCGCDDRTGGCVDFWRDLAPATGENGTYSARTYTNEAVKIIASHPRDKPMFLYQAWQNVHGPYEVASKYRVGFPADPNCTVPGGAHDCCGWTERSDETPCDIASRDGGVCKCPSTSMSFQPPNLNCPPGGQCTREYMLAMLAALDDSVRNVTEALKSSGLYNNTVIVFASDNGGAVADGAGPPSPAPQGKGLGQMGAMNNYPLRGGKESYFEGGVRSAAFVHSPLLPQSARGSVRDGIVALADWWATFSKLAGLQPQDDDGASARGQGGLPEPYGCAEHRKCTFPVDGVDVWDYITGAAAKSPRRELMLGLMDGGALISGDLKYVTGDQAPDFWYGPYSPNCTSSTGSHAEEINCKDGCLYNLTADVSEHVNLKNKRPNDFAQLRKRFNELVWSVGEASHLVGEGRFYVGGYDAQGYHIDAADAYGSEPPVCEAMRAKYSGFFGPWDVEQS